MRYEPHLLPCYGGPLDGEDRPYDPSGWCLEVTRTSIHRYLLRQDSDGSRFWQHYELLSLSGAQKSA